MTRVLVTAARGKTGREVAAQLQGRPGAEVRAATRDPGSLEPGSGEPVRFDWEEPGTWRAALDGVRAIYLVRPEIEDAPERIRELLGAADGAERVVLLSDIGAEVAPSTAWDMRVEHAVTERAKAWTILRPSTFAQSLTDEMYYLEPIRAGAIELSSGGASTSLVDTRDIAAVAVEALLESGHDGKTYALTSAEAITFGELVAKLSDALGRPVTYTDLSIDDNLTLFFGDDTESFMVRVIRNFLERLHAGGYARLTDDVRRVTGREPRSIDAFIEEHAGLWQR
jgi:uncharacterized protein YbjT (DUF2867 family)